MALKPMQGDAALTELRGSSGGNKLASSHEVEGNSSLKPGVQAGEISAFHNQETGKQVLRMTHRAKVRGAILFFVKNFRGFPYELREVTPWQPPGRISKYS